MEAIRRLKGLATLLTTLPLGASKLEDAASAFHLVPLIGLIEGLLLSLTLAISLVLDVKPIVSGAIYTLAHVIVTGGLHLDGFSDYSDVLGARARGDRAISILKDPRRGSFAVIALTLNLILTTALAAQLYDLLRAPGFSVAAVSIVVLSYTLAAESLYLTLFYSNVEPYNGMARVFSVEAKRRGLRGNVVTLTLIILILTIIMTLSMGPVKALLIALSASSSMVLCVMYTVKDAMSRIGYANGDIAGFSYELSRLATLGVSLVVFGL
ncbi:MAG: adenosylcobinamide-GDP ribazoletransferase [Thermoprotei archaeon]|nr:adenosylcobinamide-GDP ribazoletransferase [Thermoprotei archaeon]